MSNKPICFHFLQGTCKFPKCFKLHLTQEQWHVFNKNLSPCFEYCATGICTGHNGQGCNFAKNAKDYTDACEKRGKISDPAVVIMLEQGADKEKTMNEMAVKAIEKVQSQMMADAVIEAQKQAEEQEAEDAFVQSLEKKLEQLQKQQPMMTDEEENFCEETIKEYDIHVALANQQEMEIPVKKVSYASALSTPKKAPRELVVPGAPARVRRPLILTLEVSAWANE